MTLNEKLLAEALAGREQLRAREQQAASARASYEASVVGLHEAGGSLREIAAALELSHQRVHQIVDAARLLCSFCGLTQARVKKLVAGPRVYICDRCVREARTCPPDWELSSGPRTRCSFCGKKAQKVGALAEKRGRRVCGQCLNLSDTIIAEEAVG